MTCSSRNLYDSSHDAAHALVYRTPNYEHNHSETDGDQANAKGTTNKPPIISRINPELFRQRKDLGICNRSAAFRHHGSSLSLANHCRCRCAERISPANAELSLHAVAGIGDAGRDLEPAPTGVIDPGYSVNRGHPDVSGLELLFVSAKASTAERIGFSILILCR